MRRFLILSLFLILSSLLLAACTLPGSGDDTTTAPATTTPVTTATPAEEFLYEVSEDGNAVYICKYTGTATEVVIPASIDGKPVTMIKGNFSNGTLAEGAFEGSALKTVVIPEGVTAIGLSAFADCTALTSVILPQSTARILDEAFRGCTSLKHIDLSHTAVAQIGMSAFRSCEALEGVLFSPSLLTIQAFAFDGCSSLKKVALPSDLTSIGAGAFGNCSSLAHITVPPALNLSNAETVPFHTLPALEKIEFAEGREEIVGYAFFATSTPVDIVIPASVKRFSSSPFFIHGEADIIFLGDCPEIVEGTDFYGAPTIYYDPAASGWDACVWQEHYPMIPIE